MAMSSLLPLRLVMSLVMMATLAGYVAVCAFVLVLRRRPETHNPVFRAPLGPVIPVAGIAICFLLILSLPPSEWLQLACWWAVGLAAYGVAHRLKYGRPAHNPD
jgi:APA family basic amino acid/polyamine antiporter